MKKEKGEGSFPFISKAYITPQVQVDSQGGGVHAKKKYEHNFFLLKSKLLVQEI